MNITEFPNLAAMYANIAGRPDTMMLLFLLKAWKVQHGVTDRTILTPAQKRSLPEAVRLALAERKP